jgi:hypothetical protein
MSENDFKSLGQKLIDMWSPKKLKEVVLSAIKVMAAKDEEINDLEAEILGLKNELRSLKGEQPIPKIKPKKQEPDGPPPGDKKNRGKRGKRNHKVKIDREEVVDVDKSKLPPDAKFKGYREATIQEIILTTDNIKFKLKRYFSPSLGIYFDAKLPLKYRGSEFGPGIRSFILLLNHQARATENKIKKILAGIGTHISTGQVNKILLNVPDYIKNEKEYVHQKGIDKGEYLQIDDTGARLNGVNGNTTVICNNYFTSFKTGYSKSRLSSLEAIIGNKRLKFLLNNTSIEWLAKRSGFKKICKVLSNYVREKPYTKEEFKEKILKIPIIKKKLQRDINQIQTAALLAAYKEGLLGPVAKSLVSDDAPQFKDMIDIHSLCWVHEIRHYKLLETPYEYQREILDEFLCELRRIYKRMKHYQKFPAADKKLAIIEGLNKLLSGETDFKNLNKIISKTVERLPGLLVGLTQRYLPLHNNDCERDIREKVIRRRISHCHRSKKGAQASDIYLSLLHTCRKLNIEFWDYLQDRLNKKFKIPALQNLIEIA